MAAIPDGSYVYLLYDGDVLWHERLVLSWAVSSTYVVLSPDADLFLEQVDASNADLGGLRLGPPGGGLPFGLRGQPIYAFAPRPSGADLAGLLAEGKRFAKAERQARGLAGIGAAGEPIPGAAFAPIVVPRRSPVADVSSSGGSLPLAAGSSAVQIADASPLAGGGSRTSGGGERAAPEGGVWVLDEPVGDFPVGAEVEGVVGIIDFGGRGFVRVGEELVTARFVPEGNLVSEVVRERLARLLAADSRVCRRPGPEEVVPFDMAERAMVADGSSATPLRGPRTLEETMRGIEGRRWIHGLARPMDRGEPDRSALSECVRAQNRVEESSPWDVHRWTQHQELRLHGIPESTTAIDSRSTSGRCDEAEFRRRPLFHGRRRRRDRSSPRTVATSTCGAAVLAGGVDRERATQGEGGPRGAGKGTRAQVSAGGRGSRV